MTNEVKVYTREDQKKALQSALYYFCNQQPFIGALLQELVIKYTPSVPTAGITYNKEQDQFEVYLNPTFFCEKTTEERVAILHHEILHMTNKHLFRLPFLTAKEEDRQLYNIAGDMSINQYIPNLPKGCVDVKDWKQEVPGKTKKDKPTEQPFPLLKSMEEYYELLKDNKKANEKNHQGYKPFDQHDWDQLDEETKKKMLAEAKKVLKRTIEKTSNTYSSVPDSIKDLLEEIETLSASLNYKQILKQVLKRTVSATDRESTWKRPNKRYGLAAPGTKIGMLPKLCMLADTSGSISHKELNEFLDIISNFLKVGARECTLCLWNTSVYLKKKYKLRDKVEADEVESGGTSIECVLTEIKKTNPNLAIVLTDGYYENSKIEITSEVLFIISKGGNVNHPLKHLGKTILLDNIKD